MGRLGVILLASAALTALVSVFLLWRYQRAVLRAMGAHAGASETPTSQVGTARGAAGGTRPLALTTIDHTTALVATPESDAIYQGATRSLKRAALVYAGAGLVYALFFALAWAFVAEGGLLPFRTLLLVSLHAWPIVIALGLLYATGRREQVAIAGVYFAVFVTIALLNLILNSDLGVGQLIFLWFWANGPATLLLLAFLNRRVRAVGPLVLAFMVAGVTGAVLIPDLAFSSDALIRAVVRIGLVLGLGGEDVFVALHLVGFVALGVLGWWLLRWIGRRYQLKRMSDQSLTLDAMWLLFAVVHASVLTSGGWAWIFAGPVAFIVYKLVVQAGFELFVKPTRADAQGPMLLLLRVFSLGARSERLFDALSKTWLRVGSIGLIAGPDLATSTVKPHEFLDYLGGRLSRRFVQGRADLAERLSRMDNQPDPDGRHRVNDFFCHLDTWQITMRRLAARSDAVLMDLRSFSPTNQGCLYELEQLLGLVPLDNVVLAVDDTTDQPFLADKLQTLWQNVPIDSPNRGLGAPQIRLFQVPSGSPQEVRALLKSLFGAQPQVA